MWDKLGLNFSEHQETMEYQLLRDGRGGRPLRHFHLLVLEPSDLPFSHVPSLWLYSRPEGIGDTYSFDSLCTLLVFAVEGFTARLERCRYDQAVMEAESVAGLEIEATVVKRPGWVDPPKRYQDGVQYLASFLRRCLEFSGDDVHRR